MSADPYAIDTTEDGKTWSRITYPAVRGWSERKNRAAIKSKARESVRKANSSILQAVALAYEPRKGQWVVMAKANRPKRKS